MSPLHSWVVYARLRRENGRLIVSGQILLAAAISSLISYFWYKIGAPNSFAKDGLIDGLGSLASLLAGFYVAGLVAIATFFRENSSLDDVIENGSVILNKDTDNEEYFTRRQYVCSMFGFLVAISFFLAISSVIGRSIVLQISVYFDENTLELANGYSVSKNGFEISCIFIWLFLFAWQIEVTLQGIYYLMDRIYDVRPKLGKPKK